MMPQAQAFDHHFPITIQILFTLNAAVNCIQIFWRSRALVNSANKTISHTGRLWRRRKNGPIHWDNTPLPVFTSAMHALFLYFWNFNIPRKYTQMYTVIYTF
jgi:hypothetical protein